MNDPRAPRLIVLWAAAVAVIGVIGLFTKDDDGTSAADQKAAEVAVLKLQDLPPDQGWTVTPKVDNGESESDNDRALAGLSAECRRVNDFLSGDRLPGSTSQAESAEFRRPAPAASEAQIPPEQTIEAVVTFFEAGEENDALAFFQQPGTPGCLSELLIAGSSQGALLATPTVEVRPLVVGLAGTSIRISTSFGQPPMPIVLDLTVAVQGRALVGLRLGAVNAAPLTDAEAAAFLQPMLARLPSDQPSTSTTEVPAN